MHHSSPSAAHRRPAIERLRPSASACGAGQWFCLVDRVVQGDVAVISRVISSAMAEGLNAWTGGRSAWACLLLVVSTPSSPLHPNPI